MQVTGCPPAIEDETASQSKQEKKERQEEYTKRPAEYVRSTLRDKRPLFPTTEIGPSC